MTQVASPAWTRLVRRALQSPLTPGAALLLALLACTPSLAGGRTLDDWFIALVVRGQGAAWGLSQSAWDCFSFTRGTAAQNAEMMDRGVLLPWWTDPELKVALLRPFSALTHWLDEALWPTSAALMHAHSLFWFAASLGAVGLVYRSLAEPTQATLALLLYALDDAHAATLSWLANRNALIAATFACLTLVAHDRWRRSGQHRFAIGAMLAFSIALASGELSLSTLGYLASYAVFLEPGSRRRRLLSLTPYLALSLVWLCGWSVAGYGARGSGAYVDPLASPGRFAQVAPLNWLSLAQGQLGVIPSDLAFLGPPEWRWVWLGTGAITLAAAIALVWPERASGRVGFWLLGASLSLLPLGASFPSDRLLPLSGMGAMALVASGLLGALARAEQGTLCVTRRTLALGFLVVHGLVAPLLMPLRAAQMGFTARAEAAASRDLRRGLGSARAVLILNAPSLLLVNYAPVRLRVLGEAAPPHWNVLSATGSAVKLTRTGEAELLLEPVGGFLRTPLERHYRATTPSARVPPVSLGAFTARFEARTRDGLPAAARVTLTLPLQEYAFRCWTGERFEACELPERGASRWLAGGDFLQALLSASQRRTEPPREQL